MLIVDAYYKENLPAYTDPETKAEKRSSMIRYVTYCCLFWGGVPLLGWSRMDYEPSGLSCSVYEYKPSIGYFSYMCSTMIIYEIVPFIILIFCRIGTKMSFKASKQV